MDRPPRDFIGCDLCDREDTAGLRKAIVAERATVRDLRRALANAKRRIAALEETVNWLRAERGAGAAYALGQIRGTIDEHDQHQAARPRTGR